MVKGGVKRVSIAKSHSYFSVNRELAKTYNVTWTAKRKFQGNDPTAAPDPAFPALEDQAYGGSCNFRFNVDPQWPDNTIIGYVKVDYYMTLRG